MENKIYQEKICVLGTTISPEELHKTMRESGLGFGINYSKNKKEYTLVYSKNHGESPSYDIIIKGKNKKLVENIFKYIVKEIDKKQEELSTIALTG